MLFIAKNNSSVFGINLNTGDLGWHSYSKDQRSQLYIFAGEKTAKRVVNNYVTILPENIKCFCLVPDIEEKDIYFVVEKNNNNSIAFAGSYGIDFVNANNLQDNGFDKYYVTGFPSKEFAQAFININHLIETEVIGFTTIEWE